MCHLEEYVSNTLYWPKKALLPHSTQQLTEAKEACKKILPQVNSEYCKRNQSKGDIDVDDDEDDDMHAVDRKCFNDLF